MITLLQLVAQTAMGSGFVLESDHLGRLARATRLAQRAEPTRVVAMSPRRTCVEFDDADPRLLLRLTRRLGHSPEARDNCDVAWFPLGLGWIAVLIEQPAPELDAALDQVGLPYQDVRRSADPTAPIRLCAARAAVGDPLELADDLESHELVVRAVYEVGACMRP